MVDLGSWFGLLPAADEFLWILEGSRIQIGMERAQEILTELQSVAVSASIGVMEWTPPTVASCIEIELAAEQQMQRANREGGNRVCAQAVVEHTTPAALPNEVAESVPAAIPNEVTGSVNDTERVEVTERHAA